MPCSPSSDMLAQTFDVPVLWTTSSGRALNTHFNLPVCALTANTVPGGSTASVQSLPAQPMKSVPLYTVGGCSSESGHLLLVVFHWLTSRTPPLAKPSHFLPLSASTACSLAFMVPTSII